MKKAKVSKYGQWKYPGEDTIIPNANGSITMQGVPYPVLGIDDQGNRKMMMPGGEYQFPGNSVYEIPMAKNGGTKKVKIKSLPKAQSYGTQKDVERSWANSSHNSNIDIVSRGNDTAPFLFGVNTDVIDTSNPNKWSWKNAPIFEPVTLDLNDPDYKKYKQWETVYNLDQQYMPWLVNRLNDPSIPLSEKSHGPNWLPGSNYNDAESFNLNEIYDSRFLEDPSIKNNYDLSLLNDDYNYSDVINQSQYDFANETLPIWAVTVHKDSTPRDRKFSYLHQFFETPPPAIYLKGKDLVSTTLPATDIQPQLQNMAPLADGSKVQRVTINTPQGDMVRVQDPKTKKFIRWENVSGESIDSEDTPTGNSTGDFPEMRRIITPPMAYGGVPRAQRFGDVKLDIPQQFQQAPNLMNTHVAMPQNSGSGDFTTHRVPSVYDAVKSGDFNHMEEAINKYFGYPQDRAFEYVDSRQEGDNDPSDNERHAAAGLFTQQAVKDKIGIPVIGDAAGWLAANAMGIGHELGTIFEDERPWGDKIQEGFFEDPVNNLLGTTLGLFPGSQDEKLNVIHGLSVGNWLPDGVVADGGKNNLYLKDEQGNVNRDSPMDMYNRMFQKKQGGSIRQVKIKALPKAQSLGGLSNMMQQVGYKPTAVPPLAYQMESVGYKNPSLTPSVPLQMQSVGYKSVPEFDTFQELEKLGFKEPVSVYDEMGQFPEKLSEAFAPIDYGPFSIPEDYYTRLMHEENGINTGLRDGRFYQYPSHEKGTDTIGYGHKLTEEESKAGKFNKGLTKEQAIELMRKDAADHLIRAKQQFNEEHGSGSFDKLHPDLKVLALDFVYNGIGINEFPNFFGAAKKYSTTKNDDAKKAAFDKMMSEYMRYDNNKDPLVSRNEYTKYVLENMKKTGGALSKAQSMGQFGDWRNILDYKNAASPAKENLVGDVRNAARPTAVAESTNRNVTHAIPENWQEIKAEADAQAAYDALPEAMKRQDVLTADTRSDAEKFARQAWTAISYPMESITAANMGRDIPMGSMGMYNPYEGYDVGGPMNFLTGAIAGLPGFIVNAASRQGEQLVDDPLKYSYTTSPLGWGLLDPETRGQAISNALDLSAVIPVARMAAGPLVKSAGNFLTTQTPLRNAAKYNPWAWKPNVNSFYHRNPDIANIVNQETKMLQSWAQSPAGKAYTEANLYPQGLKLKRGAKINMSFSKGTPLDGVYSTSKYPGPYLAEVSGETVPFRESVKGIPVSDVPGTFTGSFNVPARPISLAETNFYKEHWLHGYTPIPAPTLFDEMMSTAAPKGNMYGQNQVLTQRARLLDPAVKKKFFANQAPEPEVLESIFAKSPKDLGNRITPENYEDFVNRIHGSTGYELATSPNTGVNLGVGNYGNQGTVFRDAPLNNLGKDIINAHEKNHGIFAGTLSPEMETALLKPFGTRRPISGYPDKHQADEILGRMGQFKNAVGIGDNQTFTLGHLNLIRKNYADQFIDNSIKEMLAKIKPGSNAEKEFLINMNKFAFGLTGAGLTGFGIYNGQPLFQPLEQNKKGGTKKKQPGFQVLTDADGKYVFVKT
jgi:hypothetical protein